MDWLQANQWVQWVFSGVGVVAIASLTPLVRIFFDFLSRKYNLGIAGTWSIKIESSSHSGPHGKMVLNQIGSFIWGSAELNVTENGRDNRVFRYIYRGRYYHEQAILRFIEVGVDNRLIGATVLKLCARGESALGCNAFWDHSSNTRRYQEFTLTKLE